MSGGGGRTLFVHIMVIAGFLWGLRKLHSGMSIPEILYIFQGTMVTDKKGRAHGRTVAYRLSNYGSTKEILVSVGRSNIDAQKHI